MVLLKRDVTVRTPIPAWPCSERPKEVGSPTTALISVPPSVRASNSTSASTAGVLPATGNHEAVTHAELGGAFGLLIVGIFGCWVARRKAVR
jgi:hypothetical protein